jgi:hypothetical protein
MGPTQQALDALLEARRNGATLRQAAASVGVHVATVCRWQARDPELRLSLLNAEREARRFHYSLSRGARPRVQWRRDCPLCQARVVVRTAPGKLTFWRCGHWPRCAWASWRPRAPRDCPHCGSPRYWSHSRKSIGCGGCGMQIYTL